MHSKDATLVESYSKLYDVQKIRNDFPILKIIVHGKASGYLDNAATTQKPQYVIDRTNNYYEKYECKYSSWCSCFKSGSY